MNLAPGPHGSFPRPRPGRARLVSHGGVAPHYHRLNIGDVVASRKPAVLETVLGSCVSVCLWDPQQMLGGMNHILLPKGLNTDLAARFGVNAMEVLINKIMALGGSRTRLVAKAFGGANVVPSLQAPAVGEQNAEFVKDFLRTEKITLLAQRLGGSQAVKVNFRTDTAKVLVRTVDGTALRRRAEEEEKYATDGAHNRVVAGETTLF